MRVNLSGAATAGSILSSAAAVVSIFHSGRREEVLTEARAVRDVLERLSARSSAMFVR